MSPRPNASVLYNSALETGPVGFGHWYIKPDWSVISPIDQMQGDQPPTIIFNDDRDTTTSAERGVAYAGKMHALGNRCEVVLYPDEYHSFFRKGKNTPCFADTLTRATGLFEGLGYFDYD